MAVTKNQTIEQELKSLLDSAIRDEEGNILATPTDMTWDQVAANTQTIAQIVADAKPIGHLGSVAVADLTSYANECAKSLLLLVSKMPFAGQTKTDTRKAIPAGTDWNRSEIMTKAEVEKFYGEVIDLVALTKWQLATGGKVRDFPFRKSVEYFFGKLRREVLPTETLELYGLAASEPADRVVANAANVTVAAKRAAKLLDGVKLYPKTFEDATSARDDLNKIIARAQALLVNITESMNAATAANGQATGTDG